MAARAIPPLNLVIVRQALLNDPALWPDYQLDPKSTYPSRYVPTRSTLFIASNAGFERKELPYGVALHLLARAPELTNEECLTLSEKFQSYYLSGAPPR
jgi:hypothetical protein